MVKYVSVATIRLPSTRFSTLTSTRCHVPKTCLQLELEESTSPHWISRTPTTRSSSIPMHQGLYRYTRLPFGVASAPSLFQKTMDTILQGLDGVICYLDDILVTSQTKAGHLETLKKVLQKVKQHGIRVKKNQCTFMKTRVQYLGHRIDADGLHATEAKLEAIVDAPTPKNLPELRSFLGFKNYYGRFIPNLASLIHPLN